MGGGEEVEGDGGREDVLWERSGEDVWEQRREDSEGYIQINTNYGP